MKTKAMITRVSGPILLTGGSFAVAWACNETINDHLPYYDTDGPNGGCSEEFGYVCQLDLCGTPEGQEGWVEHCVKEEDFGEFNMCEG